MRRFLLALLVTLFALPLAHAQREKFAAGGETHYGPDPLQVMEISYPSGPGPFSWVMFVHGGGWTGGTYKGSKEIADGLTAKGYAMISLEYRKPPAVTVAVAVSDVGNAIAYIQANASKLKLGPNFSLMGHSSGSGQITLFSVDPSYAKAAGADLSHMYAFINLDGIFDIGADIKDAKDKKSDHQKELFGTVPSGWAKMSPVSIVQNHGAPPFHICVVRELTNPEYMPQSAEWAATLKNAGAQMTEQDISGYSHVDLTKKFSLKGGPVMEGVTPCLPPMPAK